jgi:hypothetical protein
MRHPITLLLDSETTLPAFLELKVTTTVILLYYDFDGVRLAHDDLSQYATLQLRETPKHRIDLIGADPTRIRPFIFETDVGFDDLFKFFTDHAAGFSLSPFPEDPTSFHLESPRPTRGPSFLKQMTGILDKVIRGNTFPPTRPVDGIVSGIIVTNLPAVPLIPLTRDNVSSITFSDAMWSQYSIAADAWPFIFVRL